MKTINNIYFFVFISLKIITAEDQIIKSIGSLKPKNIFKGIFLKIFPYIDIFYMNKKTEYHLENDNNDTKNNFLKIKKTEQITNEKIPLSIFYKGPCLKKFIAKIRKKKVQTH